MKKTYRVFRDVEASDKETAEVLVRDLAVEGYDGFRIQEDPLNDEEEGTLLELARVALNVKSIFDVISDSLDISDKELIKLLKKISKITNRS